MSTQAKAKEHVNTPHGAAIVWFEIPADNLERARTFYGGLFGWNIQPFPQTSDYWHIDTGGADGAPDGGLMARKHPQQRITNYINVNSVSEFSKKVEELGGRICLPKMAVKQMGYFAVCQDPEGNTFGLWETNPDAR